MENLEQELDYVSSLIVKRFGIVMEFEKPKVYLGGLPQGVTQETGIYYINIFTESKTDRLARFARQLPYALMSQLNPKLNSEAIKQLPPEAAKTLRIFTESAATYMGVEACKGSDSYDFGYDLREKAKKKERELQSYYNKFMDETRSDIVFGSKIYKLDRPDAREYFLARWKKEYEDAQTEVGYHFVSMINRGIDAPTREYHGNSHDKDNMRRLIENPPQNFEELLWPAAYFVRVDRRGKIYDKLIEQREAIAK